MNRIAVNMMVAIFFVMIVATPAMLWADNNIPSTPITKILNYKTGLELTDSQVKKLTILDNVAKEKMIQTRAQAQIRKQEIDKFTCNWSSMNGTACGQLVKEYYQCVAELKTLEINAIMQARSVLSTEQLKKFNELAALESMVLDLEPKVAAEF